MVNEGYVLQITESDETSIESADTYKLGKDNKSAQLELKTMVVSSKAEQLGSFKTANSILSSRSDGVKVSNLLVNGIPLWLFFGKVTNTVTDDTHTITIPAIAEMPLERIKVFQTVGSLTKVVHGVVFESLNLAFKIGNPIEITMAGKGLKEEFVAYTPATAEYPDSLSTTFNLLDSISWNGSSLFGQGISSIVMECSRTLNEYMDINGVPIMINEFSPIINTMAIISNSPITALHTDFLAKTPRRIKFKVTKNTGSEYLEVDSVEATAYVIAEDPTVELNKITTYYYYILIQDLTITVKDLVDDDFYTKLT
jgi:hypothetical protein